MIRSYNDFKAKYGEADFQGYSMDKAISPLTEVLHAAWDISSNIGCFDNKMTPSEINTQLAKVEILLHEAKKRLDAAGHLVDAFEAIWVYPEEKENESDFEEQALLAGTSRPEVNVDTTSEFIDAPNPWNSSIIEKSFNPHYTEVQGIDESGDTYDLESPTTMRDLA